MGIKRDDIMKIIINSFGGDIFSKVINNFLKFIVVF